MLAVSGIGVAALAGCADNGGSAASTKVPPKARMDQCAATGVAAQYWTCTAACHDQACDDTCWNVRRTHARLLFARHRLASAPRAGTVGRMTAGPSAMQIDLFRAMEDIHEMTGAHVVLLVDVDGVAVAVSGDEDQVPVPLRAVLSGKRLAEAGTVIELLTPLAGDLGGLNVSIYAVARGHVLAILFDAEADLATVQQVGGEAKVMLSEIVTAGLS